jgi:hypothetical protein
MAITPPLEGLPSMILINQAKWLRNRWARTTKAPAAMATPYGTSGLILG